MWKKSEDRSVQWILFIFILAALLRIGYVLTLNDVSWVDEKDYMMLASKLVNFHEYSNIDGTPTAFRPVGYPLFLAALYSVRIQSPLAIRLAQVVTSLINLILLLQLLKMHNCKKAALWAALFYAIYPYFIMLPGTVLASTWFSFLLLSSTLLCIRATRSNSLLLFAAGGLVLGLATLTRTSAGVLAACILLWVFIQFQFNWRKTFSWAFVFSLVFVMVLFPWMLRNSQQLGAATLSTNGGRNLWLGNNPQTTINTGSSIEIPANLDVELVGKNEIETDSIYAETARQYIKANPGAFVKRTVLKGLSLWRFGPSPTTPGYVRQNILLQWISYLSYGPIFFLALLGIFQSRAENRHLVLLYLFYMASFTLLHGVYFSKVRFRLPLDHFLILMAAIGLQMLLSRFFQQHEDNTS